MIHQGRWLLIALAAVLAVAGCKPRQEGTKREPLQLVVTTDPDGAELRVDREKKTYVTPVQLALAPGRHMLHVTAAGYMDAWRQVPESPARQDIKIDLEPVAAWVQVESRPAGARLSLDNVVLGQTPMAIPDVPVGRHTLQLEMEGFDIKEVPFEVDSARPQKYTVAMDSVLGTVRVLSTPGGVQILLDGELKGRTNEDGLTPLVIRDVPEGRHELVARRRGFEDLRFDFVLARNEAKLVRLPELQERPGSLEIITTPAQARVFIDGSLQQGVTPMIVRDLAPADVTVRVELDGHEPQERVVNIKPEMKRRESFELERNIGAIIVRSQPPGATVHLNGRRVGETAKDPDQPLISQPFTIGDLRAGVVVIQLTHPRCEPIRPIRKVLRKGEVLDLGTLKLPEKWMPTHLLKLADGREQQGRLISLNPETGKIVWEPNKTVRMGYDKADYQYVRPLK